MAISRWSGPNARGTGLKVLKVRKQQHSNRRITRVRGFQHTVLRATGEKTRSLDCWWVQEGFPSSVWVYVMQIAFQVLLQCKRREFFRIQKDIDYSTGVSRGLWV